MTEPTAANEASALETLKSKATDRSYSTLSLARQIQTHLQTWPQTPEQLAEKLGRSRSWLVQLLGFLKLSPEILEKAEKEGAGYKELQALQAANKPANTSANSANSPANTETGGANNETNKEFPANTPANSANSEVLAANKGGVSANNQPGGANNANSSANTANKPANSENNQTNRVFGGIRPDQQDSLIGLLGSMAGDLSRWLVWWMSPETRTKLNQFLRSLGQRFQQDEVVHPRWRRVGPLILWGLALYGGWTLGHKLMDRMVRWIFPDSGLVALAPTGQTGLPPGLTAAADTGVPIPVLKFDYVQNHKIRLLWQDLGPGYYYKVFMNCGYLKTNLRFTEFEGGGMVSTPGALVDLPKYTCRDPAALAVITIAPNGNQSDMSRPVVANLTPSNQNFSVEPLPLEAPLVAGQTIPQPPPPVAAHRPSPSTPLRKATSAGPRSGIAARPIPPAADLLLSQHASKPGMLSAFTQSLMNQAGSLVGAALPPGVVGRSAAVVTNAAITAAGTGGIESPGVSPVSQRAALAADVPVPKNLRWEKIPKSRDITLHWDTIGTGYYYNLYASYASNTPSFDQDAHLLNKSGADWTPPSKGEQVFLFCVSAVDSQGREGAPSERILVDLR